jgi:hypothetical protein
VTTLTLSPQPRQGTRVRPVPWRRLAWVSWRQYRAALAGTIVFLAVLSAYLVVMGLRIHSGYDATLHCGQNTSQTCNDELNVFQNAYYITAEVTAALLSAVPVLVGVFAGAPILARELDTGTARFAWTQGAGRTRWTIARLALPALSVTILAGAFSWLFAWFYQPFFSSGLDARLAPQFFDLTGVALAAWTLAAFAIGTLAGVVIRKSVPAIIAGMAAWGGLLALTLLVLRKHYLAPLLDKGTGGPAQGNGGWVISQWWTGPNGRPASMSAIIQQMNSPNTNPAHCHGNSCSQLVDPFKALYQHGYTEWTLYQPGSRYWTFQWIEGGWLLALSVILIAATIWLVRHRPA